MTPLTYKTPLLPFKIEGEPDGPTLLLKYEILQPGGSFKSRGISHLINTTLNSVDGDKSELCVYSSSGGNAGLAAARACETLGVKCVVVVPKSTKQRMVEKIRATGSDVIIHGAHWKEADHYLREVIMKQSTYSKKLYVHPFDNATLWEGHSEMVDEIIDQLSDYGISTERLKGIVCSVGGGGLYSGIITGLERHNLAEKISVFAMETKGCDALNKSLAVKEPVVLDGISSVATSLGSTYICSNGFEKALKYSTKSIALDDQDVLDTCIKFFDQTSILVEPACGASLHVCYHPELLGTLNPNDLYVVILCGGSCNTYDEIKTLSKR